MPHTGLGVQADNEPPLQHYVCYHLIIYYKLETDGRSKSAHTAHCVTILCPGTGCLACLRHVCITLTAKVCHP